MTTRYEPPDLTGTSITWSEEWPSLHGGNEVDYEVVYPGRRVAIVPGRTWPSKPEECSAGPDETEWLAAGRLLVCLGCGLDST